RPIVMQPPFQVVIHFFISRMSIVRGQGGRTLPGTTDRAIHFGATTWPPVASPREMRCFPSRHADEPLPQASNAQTSPYATAQTIYLQELLLGSPRGKRYSRLQP